MKIELKGVTKQYLYGKKVLTCLNLSVEKNEIIAVLGQEGSGKTTLLKVIAGVESAQGEVLFDNQPKPLASDDVIMLFDDGALFARRNVFDNLAYSLKIRGVEKQTIAEKILRVTDDLDMAMLLPLRPSALNLMDKKKVSIARLLLRDCKVILIDDIGAGLDMVSRKVLWNDLAYYLKNSGKTVVYTTTQADEAASISDRIAVMSMGELKQVGTTKEIYNIPQSIWAVEQLDENFVFGDAELINDKGLKLKIEATTENNLKLEKAETTIDVSHLESRLLSKDYIGKSVLFGAHSEDFELSENGISCEVEMCFGKADGTYICHLSNGWKIKSNDRLSGKITVAPKAKKLFLFDKVSEASILK